jgi:hypothetical protein
MSSELDEIQSLLFDIFIVISYLLYALITLGISIKAPDYLNELDYYIKIYISLFLLWRFNIFRKTKFTELDKKIAFSAGFFLFTTTAIHQILIKYLINIKKYISNYVTYFSS